jgi:single-strand DNA-binding protein
VRRYGIFTDITLNKEITMINKATLVGRLGKDPEIRYTPDGAMVTNFNVATDEVWKDKSGEKVQKTEWHRIVTFGKLAEICGKYLVKGKLVYIEGRIQTRTWDDKEGKKNYTTEIIANNMKMLDSKGAAGGNETPAFDAVPQYTGGDSVPDDVPF